MKSLLSAICLLAWFCVPVVAQTPQLNFSSPTIARLVAQDNAGNVYVAGNFFGTVDFDLGPGVSNLTNTGSSNDIFFAKYTPAGDLVFAQRIGGTADDQAIQLFVDGAGNITLTGFFTGTNVDLDPGAGTALVSASSATDSDLFFARYSTAGIFAWGKRVGNSIPNSTALGSIDPASGDLILSSFFSGTLDVNPDAGTTNLNTAGANDIFIARYANASGALVGQVQLGGSGSETPSRLRTDLMGNVYLTGSYSVSFDVDPGVGTALLPTPNGTDSFIVKYTSTANLVWFRTLTSDFDFTSQLAVAPDQSLYIGGTFNDRIDLDPGLATVAANGLGRNDLFLIKLAEDGNFVWGKTWGSSGEEVFSGLYATDTRVVMGGSFRDPLDLDPNSGTQTVTSNGLGDLFLVTLSSSGDFQSGFTIGGSENDFAYTNDFLMSGPGQSFFVVGALPAPRDLDPGPAVAQVNLLPDLTFQTFVARYSFTVAPPTVPPAGLAFAGQTVSSINGSFSPAADNPTGYLVLAKAFSPPIFRPSNGMEYVASTVVGDAYVISTSNATTFSFNGLASGPTGVPYHFLIIPYNSTGPTTTSYFTTSPLTGSSSTIPIAYDLDSDRAALLALYNATNGAAWTNRTNWATAAPVDTWFGVTVSGGRVTSLSLPNNNLVGILPEKLGELTGLTELVVSGNKLAGAIPGTIGNLTALQTLDLSANLFSTTLPPELFLLSNLQRLVLSSNSFRGELPPSVTSLTALRELYLTNNRFSGNPAISWGTLTQLRQVYLDNNSFSGSLPTQLGSLPALQELVLDRNSFTGPLPGSWSGLAGISILDLSQNQISGAIPSFIGTFSNAITIRLSRNTFSGAIPPEIGNLTNLVTLELFQNQLSGSVPSALGSLAALRTLNLSTNQLSGSLPTTWGNLSALQILNLSANQFTGSVPGTFTNLTALTELNLENNQFSDLPNLSALPATISSRNNFFTFEDLEPNVPRLAANRTQKRLGSDAASSPIIVDVPLGSPLNLAFALGGSANVYQWRKNGTVITGATATSYTIPAVALTDAGTFRLDVTNTLVAGTTLQSVDAIVNVVGNALFSWENPGSLAADGFKPLAETNSVYGGVWADYDSDGFEDVMTMGFNTTYRGNFLYKNNGNGTFTRLPANKFEFSTGRAAAWGDYNNDGRPDVFLPELTSSDSTDGYSSVYKNLGNGNFQRIQIGAFIRTGTWIDFNGDGMLDLAISRPGAISVFLNLGNDLFSPRVDVAQADTQWSPVWFDLDNDRDWDLIVPGFNDTQNRLFRNNGNGTLTEMTTSIINTDTFSGTARGVSVADIDNDGDLDLFATVTGTGVGADGVFYLNDGQGNFSKQLALTVTGEQVRNGRGSAFADVNNDGWVDLLTVQGNPAGLSTYLNNGNGTFTRNAGQTFRGTDSFSGVNLTDYNNDGRVDVFITNFQNTQPYGLHRNLNTANNWLQINLRGVVSSRDALGARVSVKSNGRWQTFQKLSANGFGNQDLRTLQFGLGTATQADSIRVVWPSGYQTVLTNVAGNQRTQIDEPNLLRDDSTALVAVYNALGGANWTNKTNWLTGRLRTWYGVRVKDGRVNSLQLPENLLTGQFPVALTLLDGLDTLELATNAITGSWPANIGNLRELRHLGLANNQIRGPLPVSIFGITGLQSLDLAGVPINSAFPAQITQLTQLKFLFLDGCKLTGAVPAGITALSSLEWVGISNNRLEDLPDLTSLPDLSQLDVSRNNLDFVDIRPNLSVPNFQYVPQNSFPIEQIAPVYRRIGQAFSQTFTLPGANNVFQWKKNGTDIAGQTTSTLAISNFQSSDAGSYTLTVTDPAVPGLTLTSHPVVVTVLADDVFEWASAGDLTEIGFNSDPTQSRFQFYGGAWGDLNNDGFDELFLGGLSSLTRNYLYKNNGDGTFTRLPDNQYRFNLNRVSAFGDFDNDGKTDIFSPDYFSSDSTDGIANLYRNSGNFQFTTTNFSMPSSNAAAAWADFDNDGDIDLVSSGIFRNDGGGNFVRLADLPSSNDWHFTWIDYDLDGDMDLFFPQAITNINQRQLYRNNGDGTFALQTGNLIMTDAGLSTRHGAWADIDNDGDPDLYAVNSGSLENSFFINNGVGEFSKRTATQVLGEPVRGGRGSVFVDYDNDGWLDLIAYAGHLNPVQWRLYRNNGDGTFSGQAGQSFRSTNPFVGLSVSDYNNDGFQDVFSASFGTDANGLYKNKGNSNQWLQLKLKGTVSNRDAIGAKVSVKAGGFWRHQQLIPSNGFATHNSLVVQVGLGSAAVADSVRISWPSGNRSTLTNVNANQRLQVSESDLRADSLALVALYNATNGAGWLNKQNWLSTPLRAGNWFGVGIARDRVTTVKLPGNNLAGAIPENAVPAFLRTLDVRNNKLDQLAPIVKPSLDSIRSEGNRLSFEDLEPNRSTRVFTYSPQDSVDVKQSALKELNETHVWTANVGGTANVYQWKKSNTNIAGATAATLSVPNVTLADDGTTYSYEATNSLVPGLTLTSRPKVLKVSSLRRDSIALRALYAATSGPNWTNRTNWITTSLRTGNWFGVTIANNRVTAVNLPNNNLVGAVPTDFGDLRNATAINLSGNRITRLGTLTNLTSVTTLNLSNNRLGFGSLLPNVGITGINYAGQGTIDENLQARPEVGTNFKVKAITDGTGNQFVWRRNGTLVPNATDSTYMITSINRSNMGDYVAEITNPGVPNLTLRTGTKNVLAVANISGTVQSTPTAAMNNGVMRLFKVTTVGAYDTIRVQNLTASNGNYAFNGVVLDDYTVLAAPNSTAFPNDLPTYFTNKLFWEEADKIVLTATRNDVNITMAKKPTTAPVGQGVIGGFFEEPVGGGKSDDVQRNRRVANASVSVRRRVSTGRTLNERLELVAQLTTNQNGEFEFTSLPEGEYLLNLQYPGFPMDERSFINIQIGKGLNRRVSVEALVSENKIVVNKRVVTGWEEDAENLFTVYPNPARAEINVDINNPNTVTSGSLQFVILNAAGQRVRGGVLPGNGLRSYDLNDLSTGVYLLQISQEGRLLSTQRLMVME